MGDTTFNRDEIRQLIDDLVMLKAGGTFTGAALLESGTGTAAGVMTAFTIVTAVGDQSANVTVTGTGALRAGSYVVEIDSASGDRGTATMRYSRDGGSTWEGTAIVTGATITLGAGVGGGGTSTGVVVNMPTGGVGNDFANADKWTFTIRMQTPEVTKQVVTVTTPALVTPAGSTDIIRVIDARITGSGKVAYVVNTRNGTNSGGAPMGMQAVCGTGYADVHIFNFPGGSALNGTLLFDLVVAT